MAIQIEKLVESIPRDEHDMGFYGATRIHHFQDNTAFFEKEACSLPR